MSKYSSLFSIALYYLGYCFHYITDYRVYIPTRFLFFFPTIKQIHVNTYKSWKNVQRQVFDGIHEQHDQSVIHIHLWRQLQVSITSGCCVALAAEVRWWRSIDASRSSTSPISGAISSEREIQTQTCSTTRDHNNDVSIARRHTVASVNTAFTPVQRSST